MTWQIGSRDDLVVVTVDGTADGRTGAALCQALTACLAGEPTAVVVDLSAVTPADAAGARAFATLVDEADLWPGTPILLCAADAALAGMITRASPRSLPLFATVADGLATLPGAGDVVSELILPVRGAARRARDIVTEACARWDLPHLTARTTLVASELVSNAVVHAGTELTMQVRRRPRRLYVAVYDGVAAAPVVRDGDDPGAPGGRGLRIVALAATRWGHRPQSQGKVVWASFATSPQELTPDSRPGR